MMIEIERSERKEESEENDAKSNYLRDKERMMEQEQINKLLGRPDHLINSPPIDHRLMSQISHNYN